MTGCATQTKTVSNPVDAPKEFSNSGNVEVPDRWWTAFENRKLNALIDTALQSNFSLKTAWQRLRAAKAVVDREASSLLPQLEATAQAEATRSESETEFAENEQLSLGLTATYEIDLWGRIRSAVDAEEYRARATYYDYQTATLSLSAEITTTWYQLAEARKQIALINEQIQTNRKVLNSLVNRYGSGRIRAVDILRQKQLLESTREQKLVAESRAQVLEHQLAVLLGRPPQKRVTVEHEQLPSLPPLPTAGIPIELIKRRPDVRSAFNLLKAADRDLASAISNQYPRLTISATASTAANSVSNLFKDWALSVAGNLLAPLFYGGRLSAEVERMRAVKKQRLYQYGQAVLVAFQDVEDALIQEKKQRKRLENIEYQIKLARKSFKQLRFQYFNGAADFLEVLTALTEVQQLSRDRLSAKLTLIEYRIALYRALAGSFKTERELHD